jgi:zinc protease
MIQFDAFTLANGLRFFVHRDTTTPMMAMNILYDVGARDEHPDKTGFAHLFEHLMFGGSVHIPRYDEPLQRAGGENNAFTNSDFTNYYLTLPVDNIETAFWLESDRMLNLAFSKKSLEVQRQVVVEEFRQNYLNQPYGDVWLLLKPLAYKTHPYQWNTIGKEIAHIENAVLDDVKAFYAAHYNPNNALVAIAGNVEVEQVKILAEKWFGPIQSGPKTTRQLPAEAPQTEKRHLEVERNVPLTAIYKAWHIEARNHPDFYTTDLISDLLGSGPSSRLHRQLVRKQGLFSEINAYITGDIDPGLFIVSGKLMPGVDPVNAEIAIDKELDTFKNKPVRLQELRKVKNKVLSALAFSSISILNKAMNLCYYGYLGDANMVNQLADSYRAVDAGQIQAIANSIFNDSNASTLYYKSAQESTN